MKDFLFGGIIWITAFAPPFTLLLIGALRNLKNKCALCGASYLKNESFIIFWGPVIDIKICYRHARYSKYANLISLVIYLVLFGYVLLVIVVGIVLAELIF